jgi:hypothetical protein
MILDHLCAELIADTSPGAGVIVAIVEPDTRAGHRNERGGDAGFLHLIEGELRRPARIGDRGQCA